MHKTLIQNFCCADNDHVLRKMLFPDASMPKIATHVSTEALDPLVEVVLQDRKLLENESYAVNL